jgi:hypothetical protein
VSLRYRTSTIQPFRYLEEQEEADFSASHLGPVLPQIDASERLSVQYPDLHVQIDRNTNPDYVWYEEPACYGRHTKERNNVN